MSAFARRNGALFSLVVAGFVMAVLMGAHFLNSTANRIVAIQAERTSLAWAGYIGSQLLRIEDIVNGADLTAAEQNFLSGARRFGNIFRFKLFDRKGGLRLVSDDLNSDFANIPEQAEDNLNALSVVKTGKPYT